MEHLELMGLLGTTKISKGGKITLIQDVQDRMGLKEGDVVVFYESDAGDIVLKKVGDIIIKKG